MGDHVTIFEMGPRDGLQNEKAIVSTQDKVALVDQLSKTGLKKIEVTSFVSPRWVPQMADAAEVLAAIKRRLDVTYSALTPNTKGLERARDARADEVAIFGSASETFCQKNINCSISESFERFRPVVELAKTAGIPVRGYVSCVTDCPFEGSISPTATALVAEKLRDLGCYEVSLGDTIGHGTPETIDAMLSAVLEEMEAAQLAGHYHDTRGRALDNIEVSLERGLRVFDSSVAGLGGCPYAPGAKGNVATESVVMLLAQQGFDTGIDLDALQKAAAFASSLRS